MPVSTIMQGRILIRDAYDERRYTDTEIEVLLDQAIQDTNGWYNTSYVRLDYTPGSSTVPVQQQQIMWLRFKIIALYTDLQDVERYLKIIVQDNQVDPDAIVKTMEKLLGRLEKQLAELLDKWLGLDYSGYFGYANNPDTIGDL